MLSDYGISRILEMSGFTTNAQAVTWRYTAPERFNEDVSISKGTTAADVWSFAMTVIEVRLLIYSSFYFSLINTVRMKDFYRISSVFAHKKRRQRYSGHQIRPSS